MDLSSSERFLSDLFLPEEIAKPENNTNALGLKNQISEDKAEPEVTIVEEEKKEGSDIDIYDDQTIFIAPMFIVHPTKFRSMSLKLSLHSYTNSCADDCNLMLSILNRQKEQGDITKPLQGFNFAKTNQLDRNLKTFHKVQLNIQTS